MVEVSLWRVIRIIISINNQLTFFPRTEIKYLRYDFLLEEISVFLLSVILAYNRNLLTVNETIPLLRTKKDTYTVNVIQRRIESWTRSLTHFDRYYLDPNTARPDRIANAIYCNIDQTNIPPSGITAPRIIRSLSLSASLDKFHSHQTVSR